jgi:CheY-like chemotaxis protein
VRWEKAAPLPSGCRWREKVKGRKILVVDDDRIVLESCKKILEAEGHEVTLVSSAKDAIQQLKDEYFDLMIMDIKMPEKDGMYLLKKVRDKWPLTEWPELPVLAMSGYPTPEIMKDLIRSGVREFIAKPFTPDELLESVKKSLERS